MGSDIRYLPSRVSDSCDLVGKTPDWSVVGYQFLVKHPSNKTWRRGVARFLKRIRFHE